MLLQNQHIFIFVNINKIKKYFKDTKYKNLNNTSKNIIKSFSTFLIANNILYLASFFIIRIVIKFQSSYKNNIVIIAKVITIYTSDFFFALIRLSRK